MNDGQIRAFDKIAASRGYKEPSIKTLLIEIAGSHSVKLQDVRQLAECLPGAFDIVSRAFQMPASEVIALVKRGQIPGEVFVGQIVAHMWKDYIREAAMESGASR